MQKYYQKKNFLGVGLLFLALFWGCRDTGSVVLVSVDNSFDVSVSENLTPEGSQPDLTFQSKAANNCPNSELRYDIEFNQNVFYVNLRDKKNNDCDSTQKKAHLTDYIRFNKTLPNGNYGIIIDLKGVVLNQGVLTVKEEELRFLLEKPNGLALKEPITRKIPQKLIWGYVLTNTKNKNNLDSFAQFMNTNTGNLTLPDGKYSRYFNVQGGKVTVPNINTDVKHDVLKFFIHTVDNTSLEKVKGLVKSYRQQLGEDFQVSCSVYTGEKL